MTSSLPAVKVVNKVLPKVSYQTFGSRKIFISGPEGRLNIFVKGYLKTRNFKKYITFHDIEIK